MQNKNAVRYLGNAREILSKSPIVANFYTDEKYVKSACGVAHLGILKAVDEYLLRKGLTKKQLPKKVEEYRKVLQKYAGVRNGKLLNQFDFLYDELHIAGYYRGALHFVGTVKEAFKNAQDFIERLK